MLFSHLPYQNFISDKDGFHLDQTYCTNIQMPDVCPCCNKSMHPSHLISLNTNLKTRGFLASIFVCNSCGNFIFTLSYLNSLHNYEICSTFPHSIENKAISKSIENLSPDFVKIYNQAATAENNGLDEICGVGYRKALEFLIKDYAIYRHPENEDDIKTSHLSKCIKEYCDNEKIKNLAQACAWIGNDETHYIRIHEDYSVQELKAFINAAVTLIEAELSFDEATKLLNSK